MTLESLVASKQIGQATADRKRSQGYVYALVVKDGLIDYIKADAIVGPNVKRPN